MVKKKFQDLELSALGYGTMRLPVVDNDDNHIDEEKALELIDYAYKNGINYFDTAYGYHGGNSELVVGKALKRYPRESFYLATKFPGYDPKNWDRVEEVFEEQLKKLQVEYFDFYLFHTLSEGNIEAYLDDEKYGIYSYLMEQKRNGRIKHLGFSAHASIEDMKRFLDAYGKDMEFCQIQLNYLDYTLQNAKGKIELLKEYNIPVWVMEPLRGGRLCRLEDNEVAYLENARAGVSLPEWSFRFLQSIPEVTMILSGMSTKEQLEENIKIFETHRPCNEKEMEAIQKVVDSILDKKTIHCTACRYCTSYCPQGLAIPDLIAIYNDRAFSRSGRINPNALKDFADDKKPDCCIGCRSCEAVCPQGIKIADMMSDFAAKLSD